ncbi:MAG: macro domain-containing protein [Clostridia bacterium]|nr:macro domain-containing protein [Clostridia bacterium]
MINTVKITTTEQLHSLLFDHPFDDNISRNRDLYIYRGLPDVNYTLKTSLQRVCKEKKTELELSILDNFAKYAELEGITMRDSVWKKMILGQHHGLPTRLLDWSRSPLMALHFATTESDMNNLDKRDCVVWRLDARKLHAGLPQKYRDKMHEKHQDIFTVDMLTDLFGNLKEYDVAMGNSDMVIMEPPSMDERMMNQYSFFSVVPNGVNKVEDILELHDDAVTKFVIDKNLRWEIRDILDLSNVNERIVYPGLDGIAKWLARHYFVRDAGKFHIEKNNIVKSEVDVTVNAANSGLKMQGTCCVNIYHAAGINELTEAVKMFAYCPEGEIVVTEGFRLNSKFIIHAVGPTWDHSREEHVENKLRETYTRCLEWTKEHRLHSIAFPLLSSGGKGFPQNQAWRIAIESCEQFLKENKGYPLDIQICVITERAYYEGQNVYNEIHHLGRAKQEIFEYIHQD